MLPRRVRGGDPTAAQARRGYAVVTVSVTWSVRQRDSHDVKAGDAVEVTGVGCSDAPSGSHSGRRDEPVVRSDVLAASGELSPYSGMRAGGKEAERQRGERGQDRFDEGPTTGPVLRGRAVHAVQQFRRRDGGYPDLLIGAELLFQPHAHLGHGSCSRQTPDGAFKVDKDGGV